MTDTTTLQDREAQTAKRAKASALATAEQCGGMTYQRGFPRCTKRAAYLVADEYFGQTHKNDVLVRDARIVEFWGACRQHRDGHRADSSPYGSATSAWNRIDPDGSGCFNGRRLGSIELPPA